MHSLYEAEGFFGGIVFPSCSISSATTYAPTAPAAPPMAAPTIKPGNAPPTPTAAPTATPTAATEPIAPMAPFSNGWSV
ncbi:MAG: hypothetical protein EBR02_00155 [Alphaproteobacteria bacterium]|nr:hypothetical protein [Alphaproteobacteria bacterium]